MGERNPRGGVALIVDFHTHIHRVGWYPPAFWEGGMRKRAGRLGVDWRSLREEYLEQHTDPNGDKLIADMDRAGIDISVLLALDFGEAFGEPEIPVETQNEQLAEVCARHKGRLYAFVGVDPRRKGAVDLVERAVRDWGVKGLKLYPPAGYYAGDEVCYPLYRKALDLGIPVLLHSGPTNAPLKGKYSHPMYIDDVVCDFPDLTVIIGHSGSCFCWWPDAMNVGRIKGNVILDLAGWQLIVKRPHQLVSQLSQMRDCVSARRIVFGSDWSAHIDLVNQRTWVEAIKGLPELGAGDGYEFTQEEVAHMLGGNALRLLGLTSAAERPS